MKMELPKFNSWEEEFEFWSTHSPLDYTDEGDEVQVDASEARARREKRNSQQISVRISRRVLEGMKQRAQALDVPYQTLMQVWLAERLEEECLRAITRSRSRE